MSANDNDADARLTALRSGDAHGHAALLLVESLIHGLIVKEVLSSAESRDIVRAAEEVQADYAAETDGADVRMALSHELLARIGQSLSFDRPGPPVLVDVNSGSPRADDPADRPHQPDGVEQ